MISAIRARVAAAAISARDINLREAASVGECIASGAAADCAREPRAEAGDAAGGPKVRSRVAAGVGVEGEAGKERDAGEGAGAAVEAAVFCGGAGVTGGSTKPKYGTSTWRLWWSDTVVAARDCMN